MKTRPIKYLQRRYILHIADDNNKVKKNVSTKKYGKPRLGLGGLQQQEEEGIEEDNLSL
jgi:hypothetical protein